MSKIIGIDLGTSNSAAAVLEGGRPKIIPSAEGNTMYGKAFPSIVAFTKDNQKLVGEPARRQAVTNPDRTFTAFKRKMGKDHKYNLGDKHYSPQQLSAFLLQKIKKDAEEFLGDKVTQAVITVPAYFNDNQRQATKDAGKIAGLEVKRIINEPTAAALAFGLDKAHQDHKILVFDFGGGTLDVTVMDFGEGVFEVISTNGDTNLGGEDMDESIVNYLIKEIKEVDIRKDTTAMRRLKEAAEKAKIELSSVVETEINLPFLAQKNNEPINFQYKMTRAKLEELVRPAVDKCKQPIHNALKDAKMSPDQITKIILVGGPTRMPIVRKFVEDFVGKKAERGIDPMECVAMGAAIQAGVLSGEVKDLVLLDVTPLSLGIETLGGVFTKLIDRNTTIPTKKSQIFSTAAPSQPAVDIHVFQGERSIAKDNVELGNFQLTGLPPAPRGVPQIEVTFDIDANGLLNVTAKDKGTGKEQKITITAPHKMSDDEVDKAMKDADAHAEEDKKRKELIEAQNEAESMVYSSEKTLEEYKDKIPEDIKKRIQEKIEEVKKVQKSENTQEIKQATEALTKELQTIGSEVYKQAQAGAQQAQGAQQAPSEDQQNAQGADEPINTDFTKDEDKTNEKKDDENKAEETKDKTAETKDKTEEKTEEKKE